MKEEFTIKNAINFIRDNSIKIPKNIKNNKIHNKIKVTKTSQIEEKIINCNRYGKVLIGNCKCCGHQFECFSKIKI